MESIKYGPPPSTGTIAPLYDKTSTYEVGQRRFHRGRYYECITPIEEPEIFNDNHWKEVSVDEVIVEIDESSVKSINGEIPDDSGNVIIDKVTYADNFTSEDAQSSTGEFIYRTTGGDASIADGDAWIVKIAGNRTHLNYVPENIGLSVQKTSDISVSVDRDTFVSEASESGTYTFTASGVWDDTLSNYGITVSGTPKDNNTITVNYTKENIDKTIIAPVSGITATVDRNTFVGTVAESGITSIQCNGSWSQNPSTIGITVTGSPVNNNTIIATHNYTAPVIVMTVTPVEESQISATINEEVFKTKVFESGTTNFIYNNGWDKNPATYGISVSGTPLDGDTISVAYTIESESYSVSASTGLTATVTNTSTFYSNVPKNESVTLTYSTVWDKSLSEYGVTVTGAPVDADKIVINYTKEVLTVSTNSPSTLNVTINAATFKTYVATSTTITFTYSISWNNNMSDYGVIVTGNAAVGDSINVAYTKEVRGTIIVSSPTSLKSTGWNLYNHTLGYARVLKYSSSYGFRIGGTYTTIQFSETLEGEKTTVTPAEGLFNVEADGYIWVTGGNSTDTYIYMTWSDWTEEPGVDFEVYNETTVDISSAMSNFPNGLMRVGDVRDEIDVNTNNAVSKIERLAYTASNLESVIESGRQYEYDEDYIYVVRETPVNYSISVSGAYKASDHGMEYVVGTSVPVHISTLYGQNLKDKLRTDVVMLSTQTLSSAQKARVQQNLGIVDLVYPVGSIYMSVNNTSPATLFGGTWEQLKDMFLLGAGDTYTAGVTAGAASASYTPAGTVGNHTLTVAEIPSHNHSFTGSAVTSGKVSAGHTHSGPSHTHTGPSHTHTGPSHSHTMSHTHSVYLYATNIASGSGTSVNQVGGSGWNTGNSNTGSSSASSTGAGGTGATGSAGTGNTGSSGTGATGGQSADHTHSVTASGSIGNKGDGGAHNHGFTGTAATISTMPPYLSVYMWKRTA